jgi:hypothetical protein
MGLTTGYRTYLYTFESGDLRIVCPIAERPCGGHIDIVTPYGFSGFVGTDDCEDFVDRWRQFVNRNRYVCGYLQLNPLWDNVTYYDQADAQTYSSVYVVDLRDSLEAIVGRFEKRRRKQIRDAGETTLVLDKLRLKAFLLNQYGEFFERKHAAGAYAFSLDTMAHLCDAEHVALVGCESRGTIEAVALLAWTPYGGDALFQISVPGGQHHAVALVWHRLQQAKGLGLPWLNLGGGVRDHDSIAQFKERFGGVRRPLRCLKQIYDSNVYAELCRRAGVDADDRTGYFPPYRRP